MRMVLSYLLGLPWGPSVLKIPPGQEQQRGTRQKLLLEQNTKVKLGLKPNKRLDITAAPYSSILAQGAKNLECRNTCWIFCRQLSCPNLPSAASLFKAPT